MKNHTHFHLLQINAIQEPAMDKAFRLVVCEAPCNEALNIYSCAMCGHVITGIRCTDIAVLVDMSCVMLRSYCSLSHQIILPACLRVPTWRIYCTNPASSIPTNLLPGGAKSGQECVR